MKKKSPETLEEESEEEESESDEDFDEESEEEESEAGEENDETSSPRPSEKDDREMFDATCSDCGEACKVPFKPTEGKPVRCKDCFMKNRPKRRFGGSGGGFRNGNGSGGGFRGNRQPREEFSATCSDCGKKCTVPFKPTQGKPVLCRDCYKKSKGFD